jgi:UDP-glucose:(heptosyl)LPS alpha-1,3-glucosyltransferase
MRIAFVVERYHRRGGHERVVAELAERLATTHDVHVHAQEWADVRSEAITFHRIPHLARPSFLGFAQFVAWSSAQVSRERYDVVHSQGPNCLAQNVVTVHTTQIAKTAIMRSIPLFWRGLSPARKAAWMLHQHLAIAAERRVYRPGGGRWIVALSDGIRDELLRHYGADPRRVVVVPNGVDLVEFHPDNRSRWRESVRSRLGMGRDDLLCLFVGGEWERKGLDLAIRSLGRLRRAGRLRLAVAGSGDEAKYTQMASTLGVGPNVLFLGSLAETAPLYAAADVFLMPSRYEAFSLVMLEAAAAGVPIVASRANGVCDFLEDGVSALIVENKVCEIARALRALLCDPRFRAELGRRARDRAEEFGWDVAADRIDSLYHHGLGG